LKVHDVSLREQFEQLLNLQGSERAAWLDRQNLSPERLAQLQALLRADADSNTDFVAQTRTELQSLLLQAPDLSLVGSQAGLTQDALLGQKFGSYQLTQYLGRGGMASVYLGERTVGKFVQQVAVKVLRQALHTDFERRLFQREQHALATLDHPNVARLLDGGVTQTGQPYLVMELVRGKTLLDHCQDQHLSLRARVALFAQVCDGVQAAHRALIVHRDIKPGNILVSAQGQAKLLDFGVAKILRLEEDSAPQTQTFAPITPAYAAPEQFDGGNITTATDVYGLGMVLHELLTGIRRTQGDTTRASELLRRMQASQTSLDTVRFLQGDIDNILRKALAVDPTERYSSAGDLGLDIQRFLSGQPVAAHPPSTWYRTKKFVRRNRIAVSACAALFLALVISLAVAIEQASQARLQAARAESASNAAIFETERAKAIRSFVVELLQQTAPKTAASERPDVPSLVYAAAARLDTQFADQPEVRVELQCQLGSVLRNMFDPERALGLLQKAEQDLSKLEIRSPLRIRVAVELARTHLRLSNTAKAQAYLHPLMALPEERFTADLPKMQVMKLMMAVTSEARDYQGAVALGKLVLAAYESACTQHGQCAELGNAANDVGAISIDLGQFIQTEALLARALKYKRQYQASPSSIANTLWYLAKVQRRLYRLDNAHATLDESTRLMMSMGNSITNPPSLDIDRLRLALAKEDSVSAAIYARKVSDRLDVDGRNALNCVELETYLQVLASDQSAGDHQRLLRELRKLEQSAQQCGDNYTWILELRRARSLAMSGAIEAAQKIYAKLLALSQNSSQMTPSILIHLNGELILSAQQLQSEIQLLAHLPRMIASFERAGIDPHAVPHIAMQLVLRCQRTPPAEITKWSNSEIQSSIEPISHLPIGLRFAREHALPCATVGSVAR
jgi:eukaryotic-like serine/threonine-protein kinase